MLWATNKTLPSRLNYSVQFFLISLLLTDRCVGLIDFFKPEGGKKLLLLSLFFFSSVLYFPEGEKKKASSSRLPPLLCSSPFSGRNLSVEREKERTANLKIKPSDWLEGSHFGSFTQSSCAPTSNGAFRLSSLIRKVSYSRLPAGRFFFSRKSQWIPVESWEIINT